MTGTSELTEAVFPWAAILAFGLGRLRLPPTQFWALTLTELVALAGPTGGTQAVTGRAQLMALMRRFPDPGSGADDGAEGDGHGR